MAGRSAPDNALAGSATIRIEPSGPRNRGAREHLVTIGIKLGGGGDAGPAAALMRTVLDGLLSNFDGAAPPKVSELRSNATAKVAAQVIGFEGTVACRDRPDDGRVAGAIAALAAAGYAVASTVVRECSHGECLTVASMEWSRRAAVPSGWYSDAICGRHQYKRCRACASTYRMTSANAAGQAPAVYCEVCGAIMIEWGSSKVWDAELVCRGESVYIAR